MTDTERQAIRKAAIREASEFVRAEGRRMQGRLINANNMAMKLDAYGEVTK